MYWDIRQQQCDILVSTLTHLGEPSFPGISRGWAEGASLRNSKAIVMVYYESAISSKHNLILIFRVSSVKVIICNRN